jgi:cytochrome c6
MKKILAVLAVAAIVAFVFVPAFAEGAKEDGKTLYGSKCAMCHGADGVAKAMGKGSANFNDPAYQAKATVDQIVKETMDGKNKMPKFEGKMTAEQVKLVAEYIKTMAPAK